MLDRLGLTARVYPLGEEPRDDLSACTSAAERLALQSDLTLEMWMLAGWKIPRYFRDQIPMAIVPFENRDR